MSSDVEIFIRVPGGGHPNQIWRIDETSATNLGVSNPEQGVGTYFKALPDETIWECLERNTPWLNDDSPSRFAKAELAPGQFYPRIARPLALARDVTPWSPSVDHDEQFFAGARNQLEALTTELEQICRTVEPAAQNGDVFGHNIRNLLILAATEVETHWRGILIANGATARRFTRHQYAPLSSVLHLDGYAVRFRKYPGLNPVRPFEGWRVVDGSASPLRWYDAYNAVKHDRENSFASATLAHAFSAIAACYVMIVAQIGPAQATAYSPLLHSFFDVAERPTWEIGEMYIPPLETPGWQSTHHPAL